VEARVRKEAVGQIYNSIAPDEGWRIEHFDEGDGTSLVRCTRKKPLGKAS
jgi:hypothetical protein